MTDPIDSKGLRPTIHECAVAVAVAAGLTVAQLRGRSRLKSLTQPRQIAMLIAREMTGKSFPEIGAYFGRDHSTVIHACRAVPARREDRAAAQMEAVARGLIQRAIKLSERALSSRIKRACEDYVAGRHR